jgi:hypothetical protein
MAEKVGMANSIQPQRQGDVSDEHDVSTLSAGGEGGKGEGGSLKEGSRANIVARAYKRRSTEILTKFDADRENIVKTKYMEQPGESYFTTFELPGTTGNSAFSPSHLLFDAVSSITMITLIGVVCSYGFVASIPAPCPFGTPTENVINCILLWLGFVGTASVIAFHDPELMTAKWYGAQTFTLFLALVAFRIPYEQFSEVCARIHSKNYRSSTDRGSLAC